MSWTTVCSLADLVPERGVPALVGGVQVALFLADDGTVHAVQHRDPFSGANVLARGIVGSAGERTTLTSPMFKQVWDLRTGECLDAVGKESRPVAVHPVRVVGGVVEVGPADPAGGRPTGTP